VDSGRTAPVAPATFAARPGPVAQPATAHGDNPFDEVERLARAPKPVVKPTPAPGELAEGRIPGRQSRGTASRSASASAAAVPCTLDGITRLAPEQLADFLADSAVTADGCLSGLIWTWDARLAPVMSDAHVQAVGRRVSSLAAGHDGRNSTHLLEMLTYLHAVVYHDFSRPEIDITDVPTTEILRRSISDFGTAARTFQVTRTNAETLREALYTGSAPGLRHSQLGLIRKVLATKATGRSVAGHGRDARH
jgi:microbial collagenase